MLERRVAELEGLLTKLACEKADLACELNEVQDANRVLEESLSEARLKREEAEDTASHLLAEALQKDDGTWSAAAAVPACLWGVNEDDEVTPPAYLSGRRSPPAANPPAAAAMQRVV